MNAPLDTENSQFTVSLIGGKNTQNPAATITLFDTNQDFQLASDMRLYQFAKITGVSVKMFFPMPTDLQSSPIQWASAYSAADVIAPTIPSDRLQTLAAY